MTNKGSNSLEYICDALVADGYVVIDDAFPTEFIADLKRQVRGIEDSQFSTAGIGRAVGFQTNDQVRSDEIKWLDDSHIETTSYFNWAEALRLKLNQQFYLGLSEYECMFAHYAAGAYYQKHVDAFKQSANQQGSRSISNRKISTILYLNENWQADDGGELLLYHHDQEHPFKKVSPESGRLVIFLSEEFPHEVLPAKRSRYSLTGWFRA